MESSGSASAPQPPVARGETRAPWSPWVAFANAFLLGPLAGVLVTNSNLRRLGLQARSRNMLWGGIVGSVLLVVFNAATNVPRLLNFVMTLAFARYLYSLQEGACAKWRSEHPEQRYRTGWSSLGLGLIGVAGLVGFAFLCATVLDTAAR